MNLSDFDYDLDPSLIATHPPEHREDARLLVYDRKTERIAHRSIRDLPEYVCKNDLLVFNDTRVFPARIDATRENGRSIELLFLRPGSEDSENRLQAGCLWEVILKGKIRVGAKLVLTGGLSVSIHQDLGGGRKLLSLELSPESGDVCAQSFAYLSTWGTVPLPPYIVKRRNDTNTAVASDRERYQTIFADYDGSAAAPTAGLHFTKALIHKIEAKGARTARITLHVGLDTFLPLRVDVIEDHKMHSEHLRVTELTAKAVLQARQKSGRVIAVGTTVVRALESAAQDSGTVSALRGQTELFIKPGYVFQGLDVLLTNFHLPKSTLLLMVSAFAGEKAIRRIYEEAQRHRYRFYSYGDAMLLL